MKPHFRLANREREIRQVEALMAADAHTTRCLILRSRPATGSTHFLQSMATKYKTHDFSLYYDAGNSTKAIADAAVDAISKHTLRARLQLAITKESPVTFLLKTLFGWFPMVGLPYLSTDGARFVEYLPKIQFTNYPSGSVETLAKTITGRFWRPSRCLLVVDNAQAATAELRDILGGLHSEFYESVRFLLCFVQRQEARIEYGDWLDRIRTTNISYVESGFSEPDEHFVTSYAHLTGLDIVQKQARDIVQEAKGNIFRALSLLRTTTTQYIGDSTTQIEEYLLAALHTAGQPLRRSDILLLLTTTTLVFFPEERSLKTSLGRLEALGVLEVTRLEDRDKLVSLMSSSAPVLQLVLTNKPLLLAVTQDLYNYFSSAARVSMRHSRSSLARLLYHLALKVDPGKIPMYAQEVVEVALGQGSLALAEEYVEDATTSQPRGISDLFIRVSFFIASQDYRSAQECFSNVEPSTWQQSRLLRILHAIALNRQRKHEKADAEIECLLNEGLEPEERAVLMSFKISGLLHESLYGEAAAIFEAEAAALSVARNYPYFLRNGASVYLWLPTPNFPRARKILTQATEIFAGEKDWLGFYTSLSNRAVIDAYQGRYELARDQFEVCFKELSVFGTHHLEEVGFNLAVTLALVGAIDEARQRGTNMLRYFEKHNFPRLQLLSLMGILAAVADERQNAVQFIREAQIEADECPLTEARFHVWANSYVLLSLYAKSGRWHDVHSQSPADFLQLAHQSGFVPGQSALDKVKAIVSNDLLTKARLLELYSFDFHQYWSQNPLGLLSTETLTLQAIGNDMVEE